MKYKKTTLRSWIIIFFIVLMEQFLYLLDISKISISGVINYDDFWLILMIIYFCYNYFFKIPNARIRYRFGGIVIICVCLCLISAVIAYFVIGQPFLIGIRSQRWFICIFLMYFPITKMLRYKMLDYNQIIDFIIKLGVVESILYISQIFLYNKLVFIHAPTNIAYNEVRLYIDSAEIIFMIIFSMQKYIKSNEKKYLLFILLGMGHELIVSKGRLECLAIISVLIIMLLTWKGKYIKKIIIVISTIILAFMFRNIPFITRIIDTIISFVSGTYSASSDTMSIRVLAHDVFYENIINQGVLGLIFGCGYPNSNYADAVEFIKGYLLVDNGVFSFAFCYGLVGVIWLLGWFIKMIKFSLDIFFKEREIAYLGFIIFNLIISYNITFWWWKQDWTLIFVIMMCIMEQKFENIKINIKKYHKYN